MAKLDTGLGGGLLQIVMAILSIALIALLLNRSKDVTSIVSGAGSTLDKLINTVTLQNTMGFSTAGF